MPYAVLIVDDDESVRKTFEVFLEKEGYTVSGADGFDSAVTALDQREFDLIITDIILAENSGVALLEAIRERDTITPVILITGKPDIDTAASSFKKGAFDYLTKPISRQELLKTVEKAVEHKYLVLEKRTLERKVMERTREVENKNIALSKEIEERKRFESALTEQLHFQKTIIDAIPNPVFFKDKEGKYQGCNAQFEVFTGLGCKEMLGKTTKEVMDASMMEILDESDAEVLEVNCRHVYESRVKMPGESTRDIVLNKAPYQDMQGETLGIVGCITDITDRKSAERKLTDAMEELEKRVEERTSELRLANEKLTYEIHKCSIVEKALVDIHQTLNTILEAVPLPVFVLDADGLVQFIWNPAAEEILGWKKHDVIGKKLPTIPSHMEEESQKLRNALFTGEKISGIEVKRQNKYGEIKDYLLYASPMTRDDGRNLGNVVVMLDITERKDAERRIQHACAQMDQIFHSAGDAIFLVDLNYQVIRMNRTFSEMFDMDASVVQGSFCHEIMPWASGECKGRGCPLVRISRGEEKAERKYQTADASQKVKWLHEVATPFCDPAGELVGILVNIRDITRKVESEEEARIRESQLIQADKLAALGTLVAGVVHEINNPNGIIALNASIVKDFWKGVKPVVEAHYQDKGDFSLGKMMYSHIRTDIDDLIKMILESAERIGKTVSELKDFSRKDYEDVFARVDLNNVVHTAVSLTTASIKKSTNHFRVAYHHKPLMVKGHERRLQQVMINLIINACDALTSAGEEISISLQESENLARIEIEDKGKGMQEEDLAQIFDPFFTTKRKEGGTGLGMSVSHGIIQEHKGSLTYTSVPGKGTKCILSIPLLQDPD